MYKPFLLEYFNGKHAVGYDVLQLKLYVHLSIIPTHTLKLKRFSPFDQIVA